MRSTVIPVVKALLPRRVYLWAKDVRNARQVRRNPARKVLVNQILPAYASLGGRVLWVGCRRYTRDYGRLFGRSRAEYWTTDIEESHARWGEKDRYLTADLIQIDQVIAAGSFDCVLCNGVFGFGINDRDSQWQAMQAMARILKPGGRLLLGWNTNLVDDPLTMELALLGFEPDNVSGPGPCGLGPRILVPEAGYIYDLMRKR